MVGAKFNTLVDAEIPATNPSVLCRCWLGDRKGIQPVKVLSQQFPRVYFWGLA